MIRRIFVSETDRNNLSKCKTIEDDNNKKLDFTNVVVQKPWGYEYLMYENKHAAIWILHLKKNCATSMHCHPRKKTSLILLSGKIIASSLSEWFELSPLDGLIYEEGVFHTAKAETDVMLMEIESPPNKHDLVRLKDVYGREKQGYEGIEKFSKELNRFKYISFNKKDIDKKAKKLDNISVSLKKLRSDSLYDVVKYDIQAVYCFLDGMNVGNIIEGHILNNNDNYNFNSGSLLLRIEKE